MSLMMARSLVACVLLFVAGCGSGVGTSTGNPSTPKSEIFPQGLAVASPFETVTVAESEEGALILDQVGPFRSGFADATARIEDILNGTALTHCRFDPLLLLRVETNAGCYGPEVAYTNHPDSIGAPPPAPQLNGTLPTGDVGIWRETDAATGNACAAAQLNARMEGLRDKTLGALSGLASLLCTATVNGLPLPDDGTLDLTAEMNGLGISLLTFSEATLSESGEAGSETWSYHLAFNFNAFNAVVDLVHRPGDSSEVYRGRLSYRIDQVDLSGGHCPTTDRTFNGSLLYERSGTSRLQVDARGANFCGNGVNGLTDGLVDPSKKFNGGTDPDGWADNFNLFVSDFNPDSLVGDHTFSWQAGNGDRYSRVLNAVLADGSSEALTGKAFYGFGDDVEATDGSITGFFCNWAGPEGASSSGGVFKGLAQYQEMALSAATGLFAATSSNVLYAPINACDYDGTGAFRYDSDGDGVIDTDPATPITNDLVELTDGDGDGVFDVIEATGFTLPVAPANP